MNAFSSYCMARGLPRYEGVADLPEHRQMDYCRFLAEQVTNYQEERKAIVSHIDLYKCETLRKICPNAPRFWAMRLLALEERATGG